MVYRWHLCLLCASRLALLPDIVFITCLILHNVGMTDWGPFTICRPRYNLLANTANNAATITFSRVAGCRNLSDRGDHSG